MRAVDNTKKTMRNGQARKTDLVETLPLEMWIAKKNNTHTHSECYVNAICGEKLRIAANV